MSPRFLYITCKDKNEALAVGKSLLQARLVACINVMDNMTSAYWWEGEIVEDQECILIAKSSAEKNEDIIKLVNEVHSYDIPCVVALPILEGNPAYLTWMKEEMG